MVKTRLYHIQVNIRAEHRGFYDELMGELGWTVIFADDEVAGFTSGGAASIWYTVATKETPTDYDSTGLNHIGIGAESVADVDAVAAYLAARGIPALFETPRHRPEFAADEGSTYYQVMFESPDRILFEVVYTGPKG